MQLGKLSLPEKPLFLAPMEDVTDYTFRFMCKHFGANVVYTEFVASEALIRDVKKSFRKIEIYDYERPVGIQIFGKDLNSMVEAAKIVENAKPDFIDLNFGCPVKKVATKGAGSGMLQNPELLIEITRSVVKAVNIPVTVKTRLGWDENSIIIHDLALRLQDTGIAWLSIHGRTRSQFYRGVANWEPIKKIKDDPRIHIPIIGNGDIKTPQDAANAFKLYGVDGIMVGRAAIGKPWIFHYIRHFLNSGEILPPLTVNERVAIARLHLEKSIDYKGEKYGILEMRQHFGNYFKGLPNAKEVRTKLVTANSVDEIESVFTYLKNTYGDMPLDNDHLVDNHCQKLENL
ncbi:MAG TPA: tRNA dihydrouridine synthase DusB [Salinivirgaceae bacterium]|nr:tRNA dihydrouridine synthase DusB [Salinivirgaceae bacterium]